MADAVKRRIIRGVSANVFGSLVTTAIQLVTVPVLLHAWGTRTYGAWLILISLPTLLAMSDWGFENTAGNEMSASLADHDTTRALAVYQGLWCLVTGVSLFLVVSALILVRLLSIESESPLGAVDSNTVRIVVITLVAYVGVVLQAGLMRAGFRSTGRYAEGVMHQNAARVTDAASVVITALFGFGLTGAAIAMLASRIVMTIIARLHLRLIAPWLHFGFQHVTRGRVRALVNPVLAMMAFPAGFAISLQGMVAVVGLLIGPVAVVTYSTLRTLSRFVFQLGGVISNAALPEASFAYAKGDTVLLKAIHRRACQAVLWLTVLLSVAMALSGASIMRLWTRGAVGVDTPVLYTLLLVAVIEAFWSASAVAPIGSGKYRGIAIAYVASTIGSLAVATTLLPLIGVEAAPLSLLLGSLVMLPYVLQKSLGLTGDSFAAFVASVVRWPSLRLLTRRGAPQREVLQP